MKAQHVSSGIPLIIRSSKLYLKPLVYIHMWWPAVFQAGWERPVTICVYKPEAANTVWSSWWWAVCRSKHVEPSINFEIINSITRLHLVYCFYWLILRCTDQWILKINKHTEENRISKPFKQRTNIYCNRLFQKNGEVRYRQDIWNI